jgi:transcriptional regulator with XRE-family HTH domain
VATISTKNAKSVKAKGSRSASALRRAAELAFPNRIAELRAKHTPVVSQRELSVTLGISERQVRRIEHGHAVPDAKLLWRIAKALAVTVTELYLSRRGGRM